MTDNLVKCPACGSTRVSVMREGEHVVAYKCIRINNGIEPPCNFYFAKEYK